MSEAEVTVVVVTWQAAELVERCLESLHRQRMPHDLVVVDNASTDGTVDLVRRRWPRARVIALPTNTGFAGGVAAALPEVQTRYLALLNNDATADPDWLTAATAYLDDRPAYAAVSSRMLLADGSGRVNNAGVVLLDSGYGADRGLAEPDGPEFDADVEVFGASGGAAVYRTLAVKAVGGIEPGYFMYYEDTDLSWRLRLAGWSIGYCPEAIVRHEHAASSRPGSPQFAFHTERNRLLTLARCAPWGFTARATTRYLVTTASVSVKRALGRPLPPSAVFDPAVRLRALGSAVVLAPRAIRVRRAATRSGRARVLSDWRGRQTRPAASPSRRSGD